MKKKWFILMLSLLLTGTLLAVEPFQDDFSSDLGTMISYESEVTIANGICSIDPNFDTYPGAFSRMGGYNTDFGLGFWASIDVYLDINMPDANGFDLSMALNRTNNSHAQDFIFHVGKIDSELRVNANNNSSFTHNEYVINTENGGAYGVIPASGWYTFKITWLNADPALDVTFEVINSAGTAIWTLNRPTEHTPIAEVGGNRYLWFCFHDTLLELDNLILQPFTEAPTCSTHAPKKITATSASLSGAVMYDGYGICECRYHYGPTGSAMITTDWSPIRYIDFTSVSDLLPNTEYSFQIEVRNGSGSDLAPVKTFTTQSLLTLGSTEGGSVVTPGEGSYDLDAGTVIDVEAQADQMSVFVAWTGSAVDAGLVADPNATATSVEVTGDLSLIAEFVAKPKVVWVTETRDIDSDGIQDDQDWVDLLVANGYYVMAEPDRYLTLGDQKDVNDANDYLGELNAADLVVISRSSSSGNYANDANEIANWNSVMTPMICLSAYHVRSSKLVWVDSTSIANDNLMPMMQVTDANHPLFEGVTLEEGGYITLVDTLIFGEDYQGTTFLAATDMGNATVLGTHLMTYPWIAEWTPGDEYYDGAGQMAGGKRMMFMAGTQETKTDPIYYPQGAMNLTDTGVQVFLNAVEYMIGFNPVDPGIDNLTHQYTFEDGTTADLVGGVDGVLYYDANIVDGALVCDGTDDYMDIDGPAVDVNSYEALTMVLWCAQTVDNSWTMTSCMGSTWDNGYGKNYVNVTSARGDQMNRGAIAITPDNDAPWGDEIGVSSPEMNDGIMHQYVLTIDATELAYYVDGALAGTAEMGDTSLSDLDNDYIYLGKGIYSVDGEWAGSIGSFSLYNKALTAQETLYLYLSGE